VTNAEAPSPVASVVMPVLDGAATIGEQLASLLAQQCDVPFEIVVSDNGSTDGTQAIVETYRTGAIPLRLVDASATRGAAAARNAGAAVARGRFLLFCDADDITDPRWVAAMVGALAGADVVSGPTEVRRLNPPHVVDWRGEGPPDRLPGSVFLPSGFSANMAVTREAFDAVGGFSVSFTGAAGEDVDLFWRIQLAGFRAGFAPDAVIHYRHRDDLRAHARQAFAYGRSVPQLYRLHRANGMPRRRMRRTLRQAAWVLVHAPDWFRGSARRGRWVWGACNLAGRVRGAVEFRVFSV
jgi:glycosyltransferase involved in cell wall biosynthesis